MYRPVPLNDGIFITILCYQNQEIDIGTIK